ncbi:secreted protein/lipoprotein [Streptomyces bobili]
MAAEPTAPTASPSTTVSADPEAAVKATALAVYQEYWREMQAFYADRDGTTAGLKQYAASEALSVARNAGERAHARGRIYIGSVTVSQSRVTATDLDRQVPNVTLSSCLDVSRWQPVVADTRKPVALPANRLTKYLIATTLEKWPQGWRVVRDEPQGKKC